MNIQQIKEFNEKLKECGCECHEKGVLVMHCTPCCNYCEMEYKDLPEEIEFK